ncbi:MAG TPA: hypothetical protein VHB47_18605 [Thermoanaerobaculia bacterium]|jgi:hypothetical protein|nr:hypothetical protein [Thermoanaerobaculia bacterium]
MGGSEAEVVRAREILSHFIELSGMSRREVERHLLEQGCGTDLGRLLSGRLDLKLRHIVDICRVIDLYPLELFHIVFKDSEQRSPLLQRLEALLPGRVPRATRVPEGRPPAPNFEDLLRRFSDLVYKLEKATTNAGAARTQ